MILLGMIMVVPLGVFFITKPLVKDTSSRAIMAFSVLMFLKILFVGKAIYEEIKSN